MRAVLALLAVLAARPGLPAAPPNASAAAPEPEPEPSAEAGAPCDISVRRPMLSSLLVRWGRRGPHCDLLLFSTGAHGRAPFAAAFHRVGPPLLIEHLGPAGAPQDLRLCLGCGRGPGAGAPPARPLPFCCLDFSLEELQGEPGWRLNRKPIESTLVACFMTLVIVVWSVAALIWPVPIIAGFLPNGMEQRRSAPAAAAAAASAPAAPGAPSAGVAAK